MPRSNRPRRPGRRSGAEPPPELGRSLVGMQRLEEHQDGEWIVRAVGGAGSKAYRCPGCQQEVSAGTPHVVAWPAQGVGGTATTIEQRRHWHTPCWRSRDRRRPR